MARRLALLYERPWTALILRSSSRASHSSPTGTDRESEERYMPGGGHLPPHADARKVQLWAGSGPTAFFTSRNPDVRALLAGYAPGRPRSLDLAVGQAVMPRSPAGGRGPEQVISASYRPVLEDYLAWRRYLPCEHRSGAATWVLALSSGTWRCAAWRWRTATISEVFARASGEDVIRARMVPRVERECPVFSPGPHVATQCRRPRQGQAAGARPLAPWE